MSSVVTSIMDSYLIYDYKVLYPFITNNLFKLINEARLYPYQEEKYGQEKWGGPSYFWGTYQRLGRTFE